MLKRFVKSAARAAGLEVSRSVQPTPPPPPPGPPEGWLASAAEGDAPLEPNPLEAFFDARHEGPGIWKWRHYFEVYHRHLAKFVGRPASVLEIGIYSGGSLDMWRHYFGPQSRINGLDIEPACKVYERAGYTIFIGDQSDRDFLRSLPPFDVIIDDGGHEFEQQRASLEELLPRMNPGGVYICEDVTGERNPFADYAARLSHGLHAYDWRPDFENPERRLSANPTPFQRALHSVHIYPFTIVFERTARPPRLVGPKHGTEWQPYLS